MKRIEPDCYIVSFRENDRLMYMPPEIMPQLPHMTRIIESDGISKVICIWLIKYK